VEEHSRNSSHLLQQDPIILPITPNIPEVLTDSSAHQSLHSGTQPHGQRLPLGSLIRNLYFVAQCRREAGLIDHLA
jgi:hypothetical protein